MNTGNYCSAIPYGYDTGGWNRREGLGRREEKAYQQQQKIQKENPKAACGIMSVMLRPRYDTAPGPEGRFLELDL
jgi:hypothetical protein